MEYSCSLFLLDSGDSVGQTREIGYDYPTLDIVHWHVVTRIYGIITKVTTPVTLHVGVSCTVSVGDIGDRSRTPGHGTSVGLHVRRQHSRIRVGTLGRAMCEEVARLLRGRDHEA